MAAPPHAFTALADDLSIFPPTLVDSCEFDSLRHSGEPFALAEAGVDVELVLSRDVPRGHLNWIAERTSRSYNPRRRREL
ncbi:hypothetical protein [Sinomonas sp. G460-2]|uniref:hypothetical protein n=1 Tax=Sinomonas sp. G460-2 TaxID=3393464 RepID=UPI0039F12788